MDGIGPIIRRMILDINLVQNYSSKFGNSQRSSLSPTGCVNSIPPIQQNFLKNGYDENNNYNKSDENKCEINYSIITNNKWNVNAHNNMHLTKHDTNDDVDLDNCVVHTERARRAHSFTLGDVISHLVGSSPESFHNHLHVIHGALSLTRFSLSTSTCSFLSFLHSELYSELDNPIVMESLCYSAADKGSEGRLRTPPTSFTGYEPNFLTFGELNDSSVPFSFMIPSSDQDVDDVTLGKMLTEAHRGQVDYCEPEGMSVSQSSSSVSVRWIRAT